MICYSSTIAWTVMYYVTNNSRLVDAILNPALSPKDLETKIICQTGSQYKVYSASSGTRGYRKYRDMFSVNLHGQTLRSVTNQAADVLKKTWEKMLNSKLMIYFK